MNESKDEPKQKLPQVVNVLLVTAVVTALVVGFGEYLFWTKPLSDQLRAANKEIATLNQQVQDLAHAANPAAVKTYTNSDFGFQFEYSEDYEIVDAPDGAEIPSGSFAYLQKKDDTSKTAIMWIAVRKTSDALIPETKFLDKVVKADTKVGANKIAATSLGLLPGRGSEPASSLHVLHIVVPLKKDAAQSLVLTNVGDVDLAMFNSVLGSLILSE